MATSKPVPSDREQAMERDAPYWKKHFGMKPWREIQVVSATNQVINRICMHKLIPGLDADYCPQCRCWYVDQRVRAGKKQ